LIFALVLAISYAQTDLCGEIIAKYPECAEEYDGDLNCEPSQEDVDYLLENCDEPDTNEVEVGKKKKRYIPEPGKKEDNVPRPDDEVARKVCTQYRQEVNGVRMCTATLTNPIPLGQMWIDKGQASARGCCKLWTSACRWCVAPYAELEQDTPKCYVKPGFGGNGKCGSDSDSWVEDTWGQENAGSWDSYDNCMSRKPGHDSYCGTNSQWCFAHGDSTTCGGTEQRVCWIDGCHGTLTNVIPMNEVWERVVKKKTEKGCCAFGNGACDLCRGQLTIRPGNPIYLRSQNTWKTIDFGDQGDWDVARARYWDQGDWQKFTIERDEPDKNEQQLPAYIQNGDTIYLRTHTGKHLDENYEQLNARWDDHGDLQRFTIYTKDQQGPVYRGSTVYLQAANGKYLNVEGEEVKANYDGEEPQAFTIELKDFSQEMISRMTPREMRKGRRTCYKDNCLGRSGNAVRRGEQWIRTHQHSDRGCCGWGKQACDWCVPPPRAEEEVAALKKDTSMTQSISETSSLNAITLMLALLGLGSVLYGFYRSFVKVHDYNEVPDITEKTSKA